MKNLVENILYDLEVAMPNKFTTNIGFEAYETSQSIIKYYLSKINYISKITF